MTITSLSRTADFRDPVWHDFVIGPGIGGPDGWLRGTPDSDVWWGSHVWSAEMLRIESSGPVVVINGDYDAPHFGTFMPFRAREFRVYLPLIVTPPCFEKGDLFAAVGRTVRWYRPDGTLVQLLDTGQEQGHNTGMAFDAAGNLYVSDFGTLRVHKFDACGNLLGTFGSGYSSRPESIVFDCAGDAYVGTVYGQDNDIVKFDALGNLLARFDVETERRGSDWIDLACDQCTMFYTSEGHRIMRYDVCQDRQLDDLSSDLSGAEAFELRILQDGGLLVADTEVIYRLDSMGTIVMTYTLPGETRWRNLGLAPDGRSFWAGGMESGRLYGLGLTTGEVLTGPVEVGSDLLRGLAVFGEPRASSLCCR